MKKSSKILLYLLLVIIVVVLIVVFVYTRPKLKGDLLSVLNDAVVYTKSTKFLGKETENTIKNLPPLTLTQNIQPKTISAWISINPLLDWGKPESNSEEFNSLSEDDKLNGTDLWRKPDTGIIVGNNNFNISIKNWWQPRIDIKPGNDSSQYQYIYPGGSNFLYGDTLNEEVPSVSKTNKGKTILKLSPNDRWYNLTFVIDKNISTPSNSKVKLYVNGDLVAVKQQEINDAGIVYTGMKVGTDNSTSTPTYFRGKISNINMFSKVLSDSEIKSLYNQDKNKSIYTDYGVNNIGSKPEYKNIINKWPDQCENYWLNTRFGGVRASGTSPGEPVSAQDVECIKGIFKEWYPINPKMWDSNSNARILNDNWLRTNTAGGIFNDSNFSSVIYNERYWGAHAKQLPSSCSGKNYSWDETTKQWTSPLFSEISKQCRDDIWKSYCPSDVNRDSIINATNTPTLLDIVKKSVYWSRNKESIGGKRPEETCYGVDKSKYPKSQPEAFSYIRQNDDMLIEDDSGHDFTSVSERGIYQELVSKMRIRI